MSPSIWYAPSSVLPVSRSRCARPPRHVLPRHSPTLYTQKAAGDYIPGFRILPKIQTMGGQQFSLKDGVSNLTNEQTKECT